MFEPKALPIVNHAALDTVEQSRLKISNLPISAIDYYLKLAGLLCGPIIVSDTMLLDHRPLQNWIMSSESDRLEFLSPKDSDVVPAIVVSARRPKDFRELLSEIVSNRMLFSSQPYEFDEWITNPNNTPTMQGFYENETRGRVWWDNYLTRIDGLFGLQSGIRFDWPFGNFDFPARLNKYFDENAQGLIDFDADAWAFFQDLLAPGKFPPSRSVMYRWLRDNNHGSDSMYRILVNQAYRSILAESSQNPASIVEPTEDRVWPRQLISDAAWQAANSLTLAPVTRLDECKTVVLDKLPWNALLNLRANEDFQETLLGLAEIERKAHASSSEITKAFRLHWKRVTEILLASSATKEFVDRGAASPTIKLGQFATTLTLAILACFGKEQGYAHVAYLAGSVAIVSGLLTLANTSKGRVKRSMHHIQRAVERSIS